MKKQFILLLTLILSVIAISSCERDTVKTTESAQAAMSQAQGTLIAKLNGDQPVLQVPASELIRLASLHEAAGLVFTMADVRKIGNSWHIYAEGKNDQGKSIIRAIQLQLQGTELYYGSVAKQIQNDCSPVGDCPVCTFRTDPNGNVTGCDCSSSFCNHSVTLIEDDSNQ